MSELKGAKERAERSSTPASDTDLLLQTPNLEAERSNLLRKIFEEGGYAYVSMATLAAGGDFRAAEAAQEMAWEQLHTGPWHSVSPAWRDAYSMACLHVAAFHHGAGDSREALRVLDMGLIMGGSLLRQDLDLAVEKILTRSGSAKGVNGEEERVKKEFHLNCDGPKTPNETEVGKNYLCPEWKQELISFSLFLERIQSNDCNSAGPTYLAQHPLFNQIQDLRRDIIVPDYCFAGGGDLRSLNAWFGPAGTVTPLHHDPHHNILAQVVGRKYIRLYPASISEELYPFNESMLSNSSQVDLDNLDQKEFPKVRDLDFTDCILEEGDMLYIPPKWWHYVRSLTTSFSVSFWWSDASSSPDS